jgi:microcystin-dependent protein
MYWYPSLCVDVLVSLLENTQGEIPIHQHTRRETNTINQHTRRDTITSTHKEGYHYINTQGEIPLHQHTRRDTITSTHKEGYQYK